MKRQNGQNVFEYTVSQLNFRVHATVLCSMNREIQLRHRVNDRMYFFEKKHVLLKTICLRGYFSEIE